MLSENLNRLHLPATHHPPISLFLPKNIASLLGIILLLGTHAEKGLFKKNETAGKMTDASN